MIINKISEKTNINAQKPNFKGNGGYFFINCSTMPKNGCRELVSGLQSLCPQELNLRLSSDKLQTAQEFLDSFVTKKLESTEIVCEDDKATASMFAYLDSKINVLPFFFYSKKRPESSSKLVASLNNLAENSFESLHGPC